MILLNNPENQGYGYAVRRGFDVASFDYIFMMDRDGKFDIGELDRFLPFSDESVAVVGIERKARIRL